MGLKNRSRGAQRGIKAAEARATAALTAANREFDQTGRHYGVLGRAFYRAAQDAAELRRTRRQRNSLK